MARKSLEKVVVVLIAFFVALSFAAFPADGNYYAFLTLGLDVLKGGASSHSGILEKACAALFAMVWRVGGILTVQLCLLLVVFAVTFFLLKAFFSLARRLRLKTHSPILSRAILPICWAVVGILATWAIHDTFRNWTRLGTDRRLFAPLDLLDYAHSGKVKNIYFNPYMRRFIAPLHPEWIKNNDTSWQRAASNPVVWRELDRNQRFDLVLLSGPVAEYQELLDHLQSSPDWQLVYIDNGGFAFARGINNKTPSFTSENLTAKFHTPSNKARALAQTAMQYTALQNFEKANSLLREGETLDRRCAEIYISEALINLQRKNWSAAVNHANEALGMDSDSLPALQIKAQALMENRDIQQAYLVSSEIIQRYPTDFYSLLLHARIANVAHAYQSETEALEKVIVIAEENQFPTGAYRVFLGQSYAKQGLGRQAVEQWELALKDKNLSDKQKRQISDSMAIVRQQAGLKKK
ncbi:MAG: hypothetical protein ABI443_00705 [Chthoniobacterales bacterium]